jgi:very-short-patch-repair endonuclease
MASYLINNINSFASYEGKTLSGKKKVDCWSDKNKLKPREVTKGTPRKFWFDCDKCGHDFYSDLHNITAVNCTWCPYCANQKMCVMEDCDHCYHKSFASYEGKTPSGKKKVDCWGDNDNKQPRNIFKQCNKKFLFTCDTCPHSFTQTLNGIISGNWCPYCSVPCKKLCNNINCDYCFNKSFASYEGTTVSGKKKVDCWSSKNKLKSYEVSKCSGKKGIFDCDKCLHAFETSVDKITSSNGNWCPYCSNHKICAKSECSHCYNKSFASYGELTSSGKKKVDCWSKKNKFKPYEIFKSSAVKILFDCDKCGHEIEKNLGTVTKGGWCPYCVGKKICDEDKKCGSCFNKSVASYEGTTPSGKRKIDCWSDKNNKSPYEVSKGSAKRIIFDCDKCDHEFETKASHITGSGSWCPYCAVPSKKSCNKEDCLTCFNKSFANFNGLTPSGKKKVDCWSKKNKKTQRQVSISNGSPFLFDCDVCNHEFSSIISGITNKGPITCWCPYCSHHKICTKSDCNHCYNKSFASYKGTTRSGKKIVDCWSDKNKLKPREVSKSSNKIFWFDCDTCGHEIEQILGRVSGGGWCPYCINKICDESDCNHCYNKSCAGYKGITSSGKRKIDCWSSKNKLTPREVSIGNDIKILFDCDKCGHEFESVIGSITRQNTWCPKCYNKTELKLYNWLLQHHNIKEVKKEYAPKWCSTEYTHFVKTKYKIGKYQYRFDFLVTLKNKKQIIIELDGRQHYEQVRDWKTPLEQQVRDKYKEFKARGKGLDIIRCYQEDVFMDRNDWDIKLEILINTHNMPVT